jgi:hypothetical protein
MACTLYIGADLTVEYNDATGGGSALTSGTCTYALKDSSGATVSGGTGNLTHSSGGDYSGTIESTVTSTLTEKGYYWLEITFAQSPYNDFRRIQYRAEYRQEA